MPKCVHLCIKIVAPAPIFVGIAERDRLRMLRDGYVHPAVVYGLRISKFHPRDPVFVEIFRRPLPQTEFKRFGDLLFQRVAFIPSGVPTLRDDRLAVGREPQGIILFLRIPTLVNLLDHVLVVHRFGALLVAIEPNLRHVPPLLLELQQDFEQGIHRIFIDDHVGYVEGDKIQPCHREHFHLFGDHPRVVGTVISPNRLAPKMRRSDGRFLRIDKKCVDIFAVIGYFGNIIDARMVGVVSERKKEKDAYITLCILRIGRRKRAVVIVGSADIERRIFKLVQFAGIVRLVALVERNASR